jgi:hypothetical protein
MKICGMVGGGELQWRGDGQVIERRLVGKTRGKLLVFS